MSELERLNVQSRQRPENVGDKYPGSGGQANRLLIALIGRGWRTTHDLVEEVGHRFSTSVQYLRDRGHVIDKRSCNGQQWEYLYVTHYETCRVDDDWQQKYYASKHWRAVREQRLESDHYACCWCGGGDSLHVHHWRYDLFEERQPDLMTLCRDCHERIHSYDKVTVGFPKRIRKDLYERLTAAPAEPLAAPVGELDDQPPFGMLFSIDDQDSYYE